MIRVSCGIPREIGQQTGDVFLKEDQIVGSVVERTISGFTIQWYVKGVSFSEVTFATLTFVGPIKRQRRF